MSKRNASRIGLSVAGALLVAAVGQAQVYGYTDDKGVLILSNVPADEKMRLIADGTPEEAGKIWRYNGQYDPLIVKASRLFGVDSSLVRAVIAVESAFNRYARSHKGARGLMQLMPETGRRYGVINAYDPWQNIRAGTAHLRRLIDEFQDLRLALAAYNAGATPVRRYGTIPPYRETRNYVRRVMAIYRAGSKIQIIKGGKVYSIKEPGGETRVTQFHRNGSSSTNPMGPMGPKGTAGVRSEARSVSGGGTSLAELARRARAAKPAPASTRPDPSPQTTAKTADTRMTRRYYRFVDGEGVVRITRQKPESFPYDVLDP